MSTTIEDIAASIKAARIAKGFTQKQLGERVGLPQSHISKIEGGNVDLQISSLVEIARALDLEVLAEGVENERQRQIAAEEGCTAYQGFLRAKPLTQADFLALVGSQA